MVFGFTGLIIILNKFDVAKNMLRSQLYQKEEIKYPKMLFNAADWRITT